MNGQKIIDLLRQVRDCTISVRMAYDKLKEELTEHGTELDFKSEPPNGFLFNKNDIAGYCIVAYEEGHKEGHAAAYRAVFNHLGDHEEIEDLAECLHAYMRDHLGIRFEPKRDSMAALLEGLFNSGIPQLQIIRLEDLIGDKVRTEGPHAAPTELTEEEIAEQEARHAEANARLRQESLGMDALLGEEDFPYPAAPEETLEARTKREAEESHEKLRSEAAAAGYSRVEDYLHRPQGKTD